MWSKSSRHVSGCAIAVNIIQYQHTHSLTHSSCLFYHPPTTLPHPDLAYCIGTGLDLLCVPSTNGHFPICFRSPSLPPIRPPFPPVSSRCASLASLHSPSLSFTHVTRGDLPSDQWKLMHAGERPVPNQQREFGQMAVNVCRTWHERLPCWRIVYN